MKKIVTSNITDQARLPLLKRTIEFIKENDAETSTASLYAMLGNNSDAVPIILWGCNPTITTASIAGDTLTITEGAILYDGEIYQVAAGSAVFTAGQVHTLIVVATGQTEEPTKYTDNSEHITNINYTIAVSNGVTGSGICDWNNVAIKFRTEDVSFTGAVGQFQLRFIRHGNIVHCKSISTNDSGPGTLSASIPTWARPTANFGFKTHYPYATGSLLVQDSVVFASNGTIILGLNVSGGHDIMISYMV